TRMTTPSAIESAPLIPSAQRAFLSWVWAFCPTSWRVVLIADDLLVVVDQSTLAEYSNAGIGESSELMRETRSGRRESCFTQQIEEITDSPRQSAARRCLRASALGRHPDSPLSNRDSRAHRCERRRVGVLRAATSRHVDRACLVLSLHDQRDVQ